MENVTIRPFRREDQPIVAQLYVDGMASYSFEDEDEVSKAQWQRVRQQSLSSDLADIEAAYFAKGGSFWVATTGDEHIIGMIGLQTNEEKEGLRIGELRRMSVKEGYRRLGLGRALVKHLEHWAKVNHFHYIKLSTGVTMQQACAFYQSVGYELVRTSVFSLDPYHESAHFEKQL